MEAEQGSFCEWRGGVKPPVHFQADGGIVSSGCGRVSNAARRGWSSMEKEGK